MMKTDFWNMKLTEKLAQKIERERLSHLSKTSSSHRVELVAVTCPHLDSLLICVLQLLLKHGSFTMTPQIQASIAMNP